MRITVLITACAVIEVGLLLLVMQLRLSTKLLMLETMVPFFGFLAAAAQGRGYAKALKYFQQQTAATQAQ